MNTKYHQTEGFKFPAAGLIGLDAGTKASVSKFLRQRERELNTIETVFIMCINGPFHGQSIELQPTGESGAHRSAEFTVGAWRGYYLGSKWVSTLEADAPAPEAMTAPLPRPKINCDLPAKGFDQLRDLLGEMSINPLERETHLKAITRLKYFKYGRTDDFGYAIDSALPTGSYSVRTSWTTAKIKGKNRNVSRQIVERGPHHGIDWAMDDYGDLFQIKPPEFSSKDAERLTVYHPFTTYKIGRTSYTIPATIEAVERLAAKILKIKKWHADKLLPAAAWARRPIDTAAQPQPVAIVADTPPSPAVKIEQPAKPLDHKAATDFLYVQCLNTKNVPDRWLGHRIATNKNQVDWLGLKLNNDEFLQTAQIFIVDVEMVQTVRFRLDNILKAATTCNPDALRLRAKATMCRAANRPTWAEKLEAQADALERIEQPEPPEPPPGNKPKTDNPPSLSPMRQRPHKTACRRIVKIRHPVRQKLMHRRAERPDPNSYAPPAIKTVTPLGNFYNQNRAKTHATPTI